jgi:hypothetical protein
MLFSLFCKLIYINLRLYNLSKGKSQDLNTEFSCQTISGASSICIRPFPDKKNDATCLVLSAYAYSFFQKGFLLFKISQFALYQHNTTVNPTAL